MVCVCVQSGCQLAAIRRVAQASVEVLVATEEALVGATGAEVVDSEGVDSSMAAEGAEVGFNFCAVDNLCATLGL